MSETPKLLLDVQDLQTRFQTKTGPVTVLDHVSFSLHRSEILCVVGESGCGKSTIAMSIMQLLAGNGEVFGGKILKDGRDLLQLSEREMCRVRGDEISMIFQDPMSSLNPTQTIGKQIAESFQIHRQMKKEEALKASLELLKAVGIPSPEERIHEYPHQLSGGMRQRVMICMALACQPDLLIADEPTTALDVTIQAQILDLMRHLREETGAAILLITHDLGVVAEMSDQVLVLYAGRAVESGKTAEIFKQPRHPYTQGLLKSLPRLDDSCDYLPIIEGVVPSLSEMPSGCRFAPRCPYAMPICRKQRPTMQKLNNGVDVACFLYRKESPDHA